MSIQIAILYVGPVSNCHRKLDGRVSSVLLALPRFVVGPGKGVGGDGHYADYRAVAMRSH